MEQDRRPTQSDSRRWHHASTRTRSPVLRGGWNYHTNIASVLSEGPVKRRNQPLPGALCRYPGRTRSWYQASKAFWAKGGNSWYQNQFCFVNGGGDGMWYERGEGERQISRWNVRFEVRTCEANGSSWRVSESTNQCTSWRNLIMGRSRSFFFYEVLNRLFSKPLRLWYNRTRDAWL